MYSDWLHIYYSSTDKMNVKGEKKTQDIKKEYLDNNIIKISGNLPTKWEVILESAIFMSLIKYEKNINDDIIHSRNILYNSFITNDKKMFEKGKILYNNSIKKIEEINNFKKKNINDLIELDKKIYEEQKNIYVSENMKLISKIKKHNNLLRDLYLKKKNIINNKNKEEDNYVVRKENIIKKGPVPDI